MENDKLTQEQIMEIPKLLKTQTRKQVAEKFGISLTTVDYWRKKLSEQGIETKLKSGRREKLLTIKK